jgi:DNA primase
LAPLREVPKEEIERLKHLVPCWEFIGHHGVALRKSGDSYLGLCPFHLERTPSFRVWDDHYHCFGCGASGDVFAWCEQKLDAPFIQALKLVAAYAGRPDPTANWRLVRPRAHVA